MNLVGCRRSKIHFTTHCRWNSKRETIQEKENEKNAGWIHCESIQINEIRYNQCDCDFWFNKSQKNLSEWIGTDQTNESNEQTNNREIQIECAVWKTLFSSSSSLLFFPSLTGFNRNRWKTILHWRLWSRCCMKKTANRFRFERDTILVWRRRKIVKSCVHFLFRERKKEKRGERDKRRATDDESSMRCQTIDFELISKRMKRKENTTWSSYVHFLCLSLSYIRFIVLLCSIEISNWNFS